MISPFVFNGSPPDQADAILHRIGTLRQPLLPVAGVSVGRRVVGCRSPLGTSGTLPPALYSPYRGEEVCTAIETVVRSVHSVVARNAVLMARSE
jgi:hypothetical protein